MLERHDVSRDRELVAQISQLERFDAERLRGVAANASQKKERHPTREQDHILDRSARSRRPQRGDSGSIRAE